MEKLRVGIPRALHYYHYFPMWYAFFKHLGAEVIVSARTNQKALLSGTTRLVGDTCLPVKVYVGHVLSLIDDCDYIFVPSIVTIRGRGYNCPKLTAIPDVVRSAVPELREKLIPFHYDTLYNRSNFYTRAVSLARSFSRNPLHIIKAMFYGNRALQEFRKVMNEKSVSAPEAILAQTEGVVNERPESNGNRATVGIIGHPYLLYDDFLNQNIMNLLASHKIKIVTPQMLPESDLSEIVRRIVIHNHWLTETEIIGAGIFFMDSPAVDGVLGLSSFCCGPDSMMMEIVRRTRPNKKPFMILKLDEHSGNTGNITRLEAFIDMVFKKKGN